jgi:hypothetical protein
MDDYPKCSVEGCGSRVFCRGWCGRHYHRWQRHGDPLAGGVERVQAAGVKCKVENCEWEAASRGWCVAHYARWKKYGDPEAPMRRRADGEGSWGLNADGYMRFRIGGRQIMEHRIMMEYRLGRPLRDFENVHHRNGVKTDNDRCPQCNGWTKISRTLLKPGYLYCDCGWIGGRPNLELWVVTQPTGQRLEDLLDFVADNYPGEMRVRLAA